MRRKTRDPPPPPALPPPGAPSSTPSTPRRCPPPPLPRSRGSRALSTAHSDPPPSLGSSSQRHGEEGGDGHGGEVQGDVVRTLPFDKRAYVRLITQVREQRPPLPHPGSLSLGFWYKSVFSGAGKSPGAPKRWAQVD